MISIDDLKQPQSFVQRLVKLADKLFGGGGTRRNLSRTQQILAEFAMPARCEEDLT